MLSTWGPRTRNYIKHISEMGLLPLSFKIFWSIYLIVPRPVNAALRRYLRSTEQSMRLVYCWYQCCRSVSFWYGSGSCSKSDLKSGKYKLLFYFFFIKNIFFRNMICFVIYGVNIYVSKHNLIVLKKKCTYSNDFCWFL